MRATCVHAIGSKTVRSCTAPQAVLTRYKLLEIEREPLPYLSQSNDGEPIKHYTQLLTLCRRRPIDHCGPNITLGCPLPARPSACPGCGRTGRAGAQLAPRMHPRQRVHGHDHSQDGGLPKTPALAPSPHRDGKWAHRGPRGAPQLQGCPNKDELIHLVAR